MKFRNMILMSMASAAAAVSCTRENGMVTLPGPLGEGISFTLSPEDYADAGAGNSGPVQLTSAGPDGYDRVEFAVIDMDGKAVGGLKGFYDPQSSSVNIEGLREGSYSLLVLLRHMDDLSGGYGKCSFCRIFPFVNSVFCESCAWR